MITKSNITINKKKFTVNKAIGKSWRMVHDAKYVYVIIETDKESKTESINDIFEADTEQECLEEIKRLGLEYVDNGDEYLG